MEYFRLLFDHLAWIEHEVLSGIRDSRKARSLWGIMRGVGGIRKSIDQSWLAKGFELGLLCWGFKGVQEEIPWEEASTLQIGSVAFPAGPCTSPQLHLCHRLFNQDGHQDSWDFCLFPELKWYIYQAYVPVPSIVTRGSSLGSCSTFPSPIPTLSRPSGHWPCVKSSLVEGSDKYYIYIYICVCMYVYIYISSSSWRTTCMDFPDSLPPLISIVHRSRQVFHATSCICTELLQIGSS